MASLDTTPEQYARNSRSNLYTRSLLTLKQRQQSVSCVQELFKAAWIHNGTSPGQLGPRDKGPLFASPLPGVE
ncbi:MAG: hypothetical protein ACK55Z_16840, partial [bacterium]